MCKTAVGRAVLRLVEPTRGRICIDGKDITSMRGEELRRLRRRMQPVFQDPYWSLNPRQSVGSVLSEPLRTHGTGRTERARRARELLEVVGLPAGSTGRYPTRSPATSASASAWRGPSPSVPPWSCSTSPSPPWTCRSRPRSSTSWKHLQERLGVAYVFIAHDLAVVRHVADRVAVMYLGVIVEDSPVDGLYASPMHPYTIALLSAIPVPDPEVEDRRRRIVLRGQMPSPSTPPPGCRFHTRCPLRSPTRCHDEVPPLREVSPSHRVACQWAEDIATGRIGGRPRQSGR